MRWSVQWKCSSFPQQRQIACNERSYFHGKRWTAFSEHFDFCNKRPHFRMYSALYFLGSLCVLRIEACHVELGIPRFQSASNIEELLGYFESCISWVTGRCNFPAHSRKPVDCLVLWTLWNVGNHKVIRVAYVHLLSILKLLCGVGLFQWSRKHMC